MVAVMFLYFTRPYADWAALVLFVGAALTDLISCISHITPADLGGAFSNNHVGLIPINLITKGNFARC